MSIFLRINGLFSKIIFISYSISSLITVFSKTILFVFSITLESKKKLLLLKTSSINHAEVFCGFFEHRVEIETTAAARNQAQRDFMVATAAVSA